MLPLTNFDELRELLHLEKDDIEDYPSLAAVIESVYAAIEIYTGRTLERGDHVEDAHIDGCLVPLRALPVESVESVTLDGADVTSAATIRRDGLALSGGYAGDVVVTYTGGLSASNPRHRRDIAALRRAATLQVLHEWQRKDHIGAESVSNEGGFTRWPQLGLLDEVKRTLNPLRNPAALI